MSRKKILLTLLVYNPLVMFLPSFIITLFGNTLPYFGIGALILKTFLDLHKFYKRGELHHLLIVKPYIKIKSIVGINIPHIFKKGNFEFYDGQLVKMELYKNGNVEIVEGKIYKADDGLRNTTMYTTQLMMPHYIYYLLHNNTLFIGSRPNGFLGWFEYKYSWRLNDSYNTHGKVLIDDISHEFSKCKLI